MQSVASVADAAVESTTGNILLIAPPPSVVLSHSEDNTNVRLFVENTSLALPVPITVDVTAPGVVDSLASLTSGELSADTLVDSYLLHADPINGGRPIVAYQGSVTFDTPILGAMMTARSLTDSDAVLGSATTNYIPPTIFRGFEGPGFPESALPLSDVLEFSADFRTISFLFRTEGQYDQIRIVTAAGASPAGRGAGGVPEANGIALILLASLVAAASWRR